MAERTPPTAAIRQAWIEAHPFRTTTTVEEREAEFDRWLAEVKAEVLREAAPGCNCEDDYARLNDRADRIEKEAEHG